MSSGDDAVMSFNNDNQTYSMGAEKLSDCLEEADLTSSSFDKVFFEIPSQTLDILNLGRTLFELREYQKCAHVLDKIKDQN